MILENILRKRSDATHSACSQTFSFEGRLLFAVAIGKRLTTPLIFSISFGKDFGEIFSHGCPMLTFSGSFECNPIWKLTLSRHDCNFGLSPSFAHPAEQGKPEGFRGNIFLISKFHRGITRFLGSRNDIPERKVHVDGRIAVKSGVDDH